MKLKKFVKDNKLLTITFVLYVATFFYNRGIFISSLEMAKYFFIQLIEIMPAVMIISALISVWVPQEVIIKHFGKASGFKGRLLSLLIGSFSAGPIYAAFPVAQSLYFKGASIANVTIIISAWAVIKWVMFMVESSFLGLAFASVRYALTIPAILFVLGPLMGKLVHDEDMVHEEKHEVEIGSVEYYLNLLPNKNCGACGHKNCANFAKLLSEGKVSMDKCIFFKKGEEEEEKEVPVLEER